MIHGSEGWAMSHPPLAVFVHLPLGDILDRLGIEDNDGTYPGGILGRVRCLRKIMSDSEVLMAQQEKELKAIKDKKTEEKWREIQDKHNSDFKMGAKVKDMSLIPALALDCRS